MSTGSLETKLRQVRDAAQEHSQILTQKLASSPSGQNLLHIGTSLSTLPPDLHTLLTHMHPFVNVLEGFEQDQRKALITLVEKATAIRQDQHRVRTSERAADLYADLTSAEACIQNNQGRSVDSPGATEEEGAIGTCVMTFVFCEPCILHLSHHPFPCFRRFGSCCLTGTGGSYHVVLGGRLACGTRPYICMGFWSWLTNSREQRVAASFHADALESAGQ